MNHSGRDNIVCTEQCKSLFKSLPSRLWTVHMEEASNYKTMERYSQSIFI